MGTDLRVLKTRENIENQLLSLLETYPFEKITVTMIVQYSRINQSTFYRNYKDKYDLLNCIIEKILQGIHQWLEQQPSFLSLNYENAKRYHPQLKQLLLFYKKNSTAMRVLLNASLPHNFHEQITEIFSDFLLRDIKKFYEIPEEKEPLAILYATLFATQTTQTLKWWLNAKQPLSDDDLLQIMTENIEKGLFLALEQRLSKT